MKERGRPYDKAKVERAAALYAASWRVAAISDEIDTCPATVYRWIRERPRVWRQALAKHRVGPRPGKLATPPAQPTAKQVLRDARRAWAAARYREGHSVREIAEGLGLAICSVRRYLRDMGIEPGYYLQRWGKGSVPVLAASDAHLRGTFTVYPAVPESRDAFLARMSVTRAAGHRKRTARKDARRQALQADIDAGATDVAVLAAKYGVSEGCIRADAWALGYHTRRCCLRRREGL